MSFPKKWSYLIDDIFGEKTDIMIRFQGSKLDTKFNHLIKPYKYINMNKSFLNFQISVLIHMCQILFIPQNKRNKNSYHNVSQFLKYIIHITAKWVERVGKDNILVKLLASWTIKSILSLLTLMINIQITSSCQGSCVCALFVFIKIRMNRLTLPLHYF